MVTAEDLPYIPPAAKLSGMLRAIAVIGAAGRAFQSSSVERSRRRSPAAAAATSAEMTDVALENPTCRDRDYANNAAATSSTCTKEGGLLPLAAG